MEYVMIFVGIVIIVAAYSLILKLKSKQKRVSGIDAAFRTQKGEGGNVEFVRCPICNTPLTKSDNMHSRIFRPMNTPDQRMMVQGCPHCYPIPKAGVKRTCPVCHKSISENDELVARLFNKSEFKKHVMIVGCTICMKPKSK